MRTTAAEFVAERGQQRQVLGIDGAFATKMLVVLSYLEHPLPRHIPTTKHIFQKWHHVVRAVWTTERDQQNGIVGVGHGDGLLRLTAASG